MGDFFQKDKLPYICTPLTGKTAEELLEQLENIVRLQPDMIEWRADFFEQLHMEENVILLLKQMTEMTEIPFLFTIRSIHEGGEEIALTEEEKVALIHRVCAETKVQLIDYETSNELEYVDRVVSVAKENEKLVVLSFHDFQETPSNEALMERAQKAANLEADVVKLAVMPQSKEDVFRLLEMTKKIDGTIDQPVITMSMGELGAISRVNGWFYGSVLTFAVGVEVSAPGQIAIEPLRQAIEQVKNVVPNW